MLKKERQEYIIKQINLHNKVLSADLSVRLKVSEDTIRRDLKELALLGKVLKVHGGALSKTLYTETDREEVYAYHEKVSIAHKAVKLLHAGMYIMVGGGTTIRELLKRLPKDLHLTFITVSFSAATELLNHSHYEVLFVGGKISRSTRFCGGGDTIRQLSEIKADLCILGTNAIDSEGGLTDSDYESVQVKKAMMNACSKVAVLTISEKLGSVERLRIKTLSEIDYLITELDPDDLALREYSAMVKLL
ncbi:DeoR/GlpR family DNA-binding transcription regulator [Dyadobacter tibetensis]|uniref:DeoR/GlpR family DNA-binding transcription regulator n=1 Tax=Dyadobacter tibetensis TaxID=1211851 RepID=UPI000472AF4E|nr:DeoR/GlpR family DNA-binding transcription regulator [Dyadobacter tibetensis]